MHHLVEHTHMSILTDNESLLRITRPSSPSSFRDMNACVAMAMSCVTSSIRFNSQVNADLRKMAVNLVPFPREHFLMSSMVRRGAGNNTGNKNNNNNNNNDIDNNHNNNNNNNNDIENNNNNNNDIDIDNNNNLNNNNNNSQQNSLEELTHEMFDARNTMLTCNPQQGRYLTLAAIYRGPCVSMCEVDSLMMR